MRVCMCVRVCTYRSNDVYTSTIVTEGCKVIPLITGAHCHTVCVCVCECVSVVRGREREGEREREGGGSLPILCTRW